MRRRRLRGRGRGLGVVWCAGRHKYQACACGVARISGGGLHERPRTAVSVAVAGLEARKCRAPAWPRTVGGASRDDAQGHAGATQRARYCRDRAIAAALGGGVFPNERCPGRQEAAGDEWGGVTVPNIPHCLPAIERRPRSVCERLVRTYTAQIAASRQATAGHQGSNATSLGAARPTPRYDEVGALVERGLGEVPRVDVGAGLEDGQLLKTGQRGLLGGGEVGWKRLGGMLHGAWRGRRRAVCSAAWGAAAAGLVARRNCGDGRPAARNPATVDVRALRAACLAESASEIFPSMSAGSSWPATGLKIRKGRRGRDSSMGASALVRAAVRCLSPAAAAAARLR